MILALSVYGLIALFDIPMSELNGRASHGGELQITN